MLTPQIACREYSTWLDTSHSTSETTNCKHITASARCRLGTDKGKDKMQRRSPSIARTVTPLQRITNAVAVLSLVVTQNHCITSPLSTFFLPSGYEISPRAKEVSRSCVRGETASTLPPALIPLLLTIVLRARVARELLSGSYRATIENLIQRRVPIHPDDIGHIRYRKDLRANTPSAPSSKQTH